MAKPTADQMEEFWRLVNRGLVTSMHIQFVIDGRANIDDVLLMVHYGGRLFQKYTFIGSELHNEHYFWARWPRGHVKPAKLGFIVLKQDTPLSLAREMLYYQVGHSAPDLAESEAFFDAHPEMVEDGPIAALCGKSGMDASGTIPGMALIQARTGHIELDWKFDSYKLKEGTRLLVVHL